MTPQDHADVRPFRSLFPRLFRKGVEVMSVAQLAAVAQALPEATRQAVADFLGPEGVAAVAEDLPPDKAELLVSAYPAAGDLDRQPFVDHYPAVMLATNEQLTTEQLTTVLQALGPVDLLSQSLFLGVRGRRHVLGRLRREQVEAILDHSDDWVLLETARDALTSYGQYRCVLEKQERVGGKLQGLERIELKTRQTPRAIYMRWIGGLWKGRQALYNEAVLGPGKVRVRESGLLGVVPITLAVDSALAGRGTNHRITEVGLHHLVALLEQDYVRAQPRGHLERVNHGLVELDGRPVYKIESRLPPDPALGYYCHRVVHYTDYVNAIDVKAEVYDFEDRLKETFHYRELTVDPGLTDHDFDPKNRAYRL
ncbi:MAG: DUF1571 domain-containing protein [bacterium]